MSELPFDPVLGKGAEQIEVSNSEIQTFKSCRRRWYLGNYLGLAKKDKQMTGPLPLGTRIHDALEAYYTKDQDLIEAYNRLQRKDAQLFLMTEEADHEEKIKKFNSESELGLIMLEGYLDWLEEENEDSKIKVVSAEKKLEYNVEQFHDSRINIIGKVDMHVRRKEDGTTAIMDHKALHVDQNVLTPTGYKRIGDTKVGDELLAPDGTLTKVTGVYPQGVVHLNKVSFADHTSVLACDDHLWTTYKTKSSKDKRTSVQYLESTKELSSVVRKKTSKGTELRTRAIPVVCPKAIEFPSKELPISPYILGALIGDGNLTPATMVKFSTSDKFILDEIIRESKGLLEYYHISRYDYGLFDTSVRQYFDGNRICLERPLIRELTMLGLMGKKSYEKAIPDNYKYTSVEDRIALLQGIMDTDGFVRNYSEKSRGQVALYCTSEKLVHDVAWIVRSLGGLATINQNPKNTKCHKPDGSILECRTGYYISIRLPEGVCPFRLPKKVEAYNSFKRTVEYRIVDNIADAGYGEAVCISVDHPDKLYITDDFIVTHNTVAPSGFNTYYMTSHMSEQLMLYCLLEELSGDGIKVDGGIYNLLKKVKRTGSAKPPFYERIDVRFNRHTMHAFWTRLMGTLDDMMRVRDALDQGADHRFVAYPSPTKDCTWICPFFLVCSMMDDGSSADRMLEDQYVQVDPLQRYKTEDENKENNG